MKIICQMQPHNEFSYHTLKLISIIMNRVFHPWTYEAEIYFWIELSILSDKLREIKNCIKQLCCFAIYISRYEFIIVGGLWSMIMRDFASWFSWHPAEIYWNDDTLLAFRCHCSVERIVRSSQGLFILSREKKEWSTNLLRTMRGQPMISIGQMEKKDVGIILTYWNNSFRNWNKI